MQLSCAIIANKYSKWTGIKLGKNGCMIKNVLNIVALIHISC